MQPLKRLPANLLLGLRWLQCKLLNKNFMSSQNRELIALLVLIFIMPFVGGLFFLVFAGGLILMFGGMEDLVRLTQDWSWIPPYGHQGNFKILIGIALALAMMSAIVFWQRIFWRKSLGGDSMHSESVIERNGDGWGVFAYFAFSLLAAYLAYDASNRGGVLISLLFCCVATWALSWAIIKIVKK